MINIVATLKKVFFFISPIKVSFPIEKPKVYVEIIPSQLINIVSKPFDQVSLVSSPENNTLGYQAINDAVIDAQHIGFALLAEVIPEDLFFFFGETVQALQDAFFSFNSERYIPYNHTDFYAPVNNDKGRSCNKSNAKPLAIILCKVVNTECFRNIIFDKQKHATKHNNC